MQLLPLMKSTLPVQPLRLLPLMKSTLQEQPLWLLPLMLSLRLPPRWLPYRRKLRIPPEA